MDTLTVTTSESSNARMSTWQDSLGMVASIGCAIHCAAMPFVIAYLPALGLSFLADEAFHQWMALVCFLIAIGAFDGAFNEANRGKALIVHPCGSLFYHCFNDFARGFDDAAFADVIGA